MGITRHSKLNSKKEKNKEEEISPLLSKNTVKKGAQETFTSSDASFLINKLRQANYTGTEFEQFYTIMAKLTKIISDSKD